jgi:hypothetical protein
MHSVVDSSSWRWSASCAHQLQRQETYDSALLLVHVQHARHAASACCECMPLFCEHCSASVKLLPRNFIVCNWTSIVCVKGELNRVTFVLAWFAFGLLVSYICLHLLVPAPGLYPLTHFSLGQTRPEAQGPLTLWAAIAYTHTICIDRRLKDLSLEVCSCMNTALCS